MRSVVRRARTYIVTTAAAGTLLLSGCSLPIFGAEAAPTIAPQSGTELQFTTYTHPEWGYTVDIPQGAGISHNRDGRVTTAAYADDTIVRGSYNTQIEVVPEIGAVTPGQMLQQAVQPVISNPPAPSPISTNGGALPGAQIIYAAADGDVCEERNAVMAGFVVNGTGYLVRVSSDGLNRCDTAAIPETKRIIDSFRPPAGS